MNYAEEIALRVAFLKDQLEKSGCSGFIFGNSGGKDCALVGILCKLACDNTLSVMLPCGSKQNYGSDMEDAQTLCESFKIESCTVDLTDTREAMLSSLSDFNLTDGAVNNIAPRLRMTALYSIAAARRCLVAGTGNRCERFMGYFTKWGDGAFDLNPISDLTVSEVYGLLRYLGAPARIISKAPSAGLFDGQTDEQEMGVSYDAVERYLAGESVSDTEREIIERYHRSSLHKLNPPPMYRTVQD